MNKRQRKKLIKKHNIQKMVSGVWYHSDDIMRDADLIKEARKYFPRIGVMGNFQIWNRALSNEEMNQVYETNKSEILKRANQENDVAI